MTGATGLIGANLLPVLQRDWEVIGLSSHKPQINLDSKNIHYLTVDLSQEWDTTLWPDGVEVIIHLAQSKYFRNFPEYSGDVFQVNTVSTLRLLDYARRIGASTFIFASSGGIYGFGPQEFSEDTTISLRGDIGFYLSTKLCAEVLAENYTPFMKIIMLRFFFVYGPGQRSDMLIPRLVQNVLERKPITLQGQEGLWINPIYVTDAVTAINQALYLNDNHKINVAGPEILSLQKIAEIIGQVVDKEPVFDRQLDSPPRHLVGDIRKMSHLLGPPSVRFEDGIRSYLKSIQI